MKCYEFATLSVQTATAGKAVAAAERYLAANAHRATLHAVWTADIGTLNRVQIVRSFTSSDALVAERERMLIDGDLFGATDLLTGLALDTYASFPFVAPLGTGTYGNIYEVREYRIRPAGLKHTLAAWEAALPARQTHSTIVFAGYALDGAVPRMIHVCPYQGLDQRSRIRGEAVAAGIWPPKGGPDWLTDMQSTIYLPAAFSPLR